MHIFLFWIQSYRLLAEDRKRFFRLVLWIGSVFCVFSGTQGIVKVVVVFIVAHQQHTVQLAVIGYLLALLGTPVSVAVAIAHIGGGQYHDRDASVYIPVTELCQRQGIGMVYMPVLRQDKSF